MRRLLFVAFFLEVGFVLVVAPWSEYWDHNYFLPDVSVLRDVLTSNYVRGGVSGLGLVNLFAAFAEFTGLLVSRTASRAVSSSVDKP